MSNLVNVFNFDGYQIRTIVQDGEPWFVAGEVASALGYASTQHAVADHCKYAKILKGDSVSQLTSSPRGITIIPEGDVYRLTMKSRLASAVKFQDWVTDEVLPTIRKTGQYVAAELTELEAAKQYLAIAQKYVEVVEEKEKLAIELREAQPKLVGFTKLIDSEDLFTVDQVAKNNGVGPNKLRDYMRMLGFLRADKANWNQPSAPIMKILAPHLKKVHGLSPKEYRKQFAIPASVPLAAKAYSQKRKDLALLNGLADRLKAGKPLN